MQRDDSQEESLEKRKKLNTIVDGDISERSSIILAKLSAIRGTIVKEDNNAITLNEQCEDIQENIVNSSFRSKRNSQKQDTKILFAKDCSPSFQAENSPEMNRGGRNMFTSRGRFNQRAEEDRGATDNFNDRRQPDSRSPMERSAFRPMDVFQSRRGRNERDRSSERERCRGSEASTSRCESNSQRSRSKDRHRGKRSRSISPQSEYLKVHDRWKKFKQSQRVMLDGVQRKREIYDKRPEDHPDYPEEWRLFWEKRYKELQAQGKDADNHDYKTEWIPFWGKRVQEIYEAEIKVKTESMLHKYELQSSNEPKKEEFPDPQTSQMNKTNSEKDEKDEISNFVGDYQRYRSERGNDDLMVVEDYSSNANNHNRSQNEKRDRDRDRNYKEYDRDRQNGSNRDRGRKYDSPDRSRRRNERDRSRSKDRGGTWHRKTSGRIHERTRGESPSTDKLFESDINKRFSGGRHSPANQDAMSGLTALENLRDRGVSRSPIKDSRSENEKHVPLRGGTYNLMTRELQDTSPRLMESLRILTALEDLLGSLGPQINIILSKAITLENNKEGSGNVLLEDQDVAAILQMTKEKLSGQIIAGLLEPQKEFAVRNCVDKLTMILQIATKARPLNPPSLSILSNRNESTEKLKNKYKKMIAEQMAKLLMKRGLQNIDDWYLHYLVFEVAKTTPLDDGSLVPPPDRKMDKIEASHKSSGPAEGYSTGMSSEKSSIIFEENTNTISRSMESLKGRLVSTGRAGEFDDLTTHELKLLLENFKNLSQPEQTDLINYMKKQEIVNPDKVDHLKSLFPALFGSNLNENDKTPTDGLGSAMLQVLARNVQRFTNDNNQSQEEINKRSNEDHFSSEAVQLHSSQDPMNSLNCSRVNIFDTSLSSETRVPDPLERKVNKNSRNNSSLSNALGAPPPPPPPPENRSSQNFEQHSQTFGGDLSYHSQSANNHNIAESITSNPPPVFNHRENIQFEHVQNNSTGYANYGTMVNYPPGRGNFSVPQFNNGIRANASGPRSHMPSPYGNSQIFPTQNQRPRFW